MAIHGHTEAKTSEVYAEGVEQRWTLAADAMRTLEDMEWRVMVAMPFIATQLNKGFESS